jgi:hypothetical protein
MARLIKRTFDPTKPTIVRRFFVGAGRHYNPGEVFDWRRLSVDQRRVRLLFDAGKLMHAEQPSPSFAETLATEGPVVTPAPAIAQERVYDDIQHIAVTAPAQDDQPTAPIEPVDDLDNLNMRELRVIAEAEGAPTRLRRTDQRDAIRENRRGQK